MLFCLPKRVTGNINKRILFAREMLTKVLFKIYVGYKTRSLNISLFQDTKKYINKVGNTTCRMTSHFKYMPVLLIFFKKQKIFMIFLSFLLMNAGDDGDGDEVNESSTSLISL